MADKRLSGPKTSGLRGRSAIACSSQESPKTVVHTSIFTGLTDPPGTILIPRSQSSDAVLDSQPPPDLNVEVAYNDRNSDQDSIVQDSSKDVSGVADLAVGTRTNEQDRSAELTQHTSRIEEPQATSNVHLKGQAVLNMQPKSSRMSDTASLTAQELVKAQPKLDSINTSRTTGSIAALSTATSQQRLKEMRAARSFAANQVMEEIFTPVSAEAKNNHQSISPLRFVIPEPRLDEVPQPPDALKSAVDSESKKNLITYAKQRGSRSKILVASTGLPTGIHAEQGSLPLAGNRDTNSTDSASKLASKVNPKIGDDGAWKISESPKTRSVQHRSDDKPIKQCTPAKENLTVIDDDDDDSLNSEDDDDDDDEDEDYRSKSLKTPAPGSRTTRASRQNGPLLELGRDIKKGPRRQNEGKPNDEVAQTRRPHGTAKAHEQQQRDESLDDFENSMTYMHSGGIDREHDTENRISHIQSPPNNASHGFTEPTRDSVGETYNRTEAEESQETFMNIVAPKNLGLERDLATSSSSKDGDTEENPVVLDDSGQEDLSDDSSDASSADEDDEPGGEDRSPSLSNNKCSSPPVPKTALRPENKMCLERDLRTAERSARLNKPHLIHFSQDGPKNQGILPDKKTTVHAARNHTPGSKAEPCPRQQPPKGSVEEAMMEILDRSSKGPRALVCDEGVTADDHVTPNRGGLDRTLTKAASGVPSKEFVSPPKTGPEPDKIPVIITRPDSVKPGAILRDVTKHSAEQLQMAMVEAASPHGKSEPSWPSLLDQVKRMSEKSINDKTKADFERSKQDEEGQKNTLEPNKRIKNVATQNQHFVPSKRFSITVSGGDTQSITKSGLGKSILTLLTDANGRKRGTGGATSPETDQEAVPLPGVSRDAFRTNEGDVRMGQFTNALSNAKTKLSEDLSAGRRKDIRFRGKNAPLPSASITTSAVENGTKRHSNTEFAGLPQKRAKFLGSNYPKRSMGNVLGTDAGARFIKASQRRITSDGSPVRQEQEVSYSQQQQEFDNSPGHGMPLVHAPSRYFLKVRDDGLRGGSSSSEHETEDILVDDGSTLIDGFHDLAKSEPLEHKVYSQAITHAGFDGGTSDESASQHTGATDVEEDPFVGFTEQGIMELEQAAQTQQTGQRSYFSRLKSEVRRKFEAELGVIEKQADDEEVRIDEEDPDKTLIEEQDEDEEWSQVSDEGTDGLESMDDHRRHAKTLEPHQRSVYEAVFRIGHELVSHLIDAETAIKDVVKDLHEECMTLIEQMEESHKEKLDKYFEDAMKSKREVAKSFRLTAKQSEKGMKEVEMSGEKHRESMKGGKDGLKMLDDLLQRCN